MGLLKNVESGSGRSKIPVPCSPGPEGRAVLSFRGTTDRVPAFVEWVFYIPLAGAAWQLPHLKSISDFRIPLPHFSFTILPTARE